MRQKAQRKGLCAVCCCLTPTDLIYAPKTREREKSRKAAIFCYVTKFFSVLIDEGKLKLRENAGILAARACGLAYNTYRRYLGGKTELPAPDNVKNKRKERRDTKIDPDLYAKIRGQIRRWNDGFDCQDALGGYRFVSTK